MVSDIVLIVDDDQMVRESVSALVESLGMEARAYASAERLLDDSLWLESVVSAHRVCIISDLRMTGMSGTDLQSALSERKLRIPTIIVSGFADVSVTVKAMRLGAITVLEKPCETAQLVAAIHEALAVKSSS